MENRDDGSTRFPMMNVDLGFASRGYHAKALIDTGADLIAVEEEILKNLGCPLTGDVHTVRTPNGDRACNRYRVIIEFAAIEVRAEIEVTGMNLSNRRYQAIFGVPLLELGILHVDPRNESYFDIYSDRLAPPIS
jgi:predicted aspartyl protease